MPQAALIILAVVAIAQAGLAIQAGSAAKKEAKNRANLRRIELNLDAQRRTLDRARTESALQRQARSRSADILNTAVGGGLTLAGNTSLRGSLSAVRANLAREQVFSSQAFELAISGDAVTLTQIALEQKSAVRKATAAQISAGLGAISTIASSGIADISSPTPNVGGSSFGPSGSGTTSGI